MEKSSQEILFIERRLFRSVWFVENLNNGKSRMKYYFQMKRNATTHQ